MPLTPRQQRFVAEFLVDLNASAAARRAGYAAKNADVQGPRLLVNVGIQAAIAAGTAQKLTRAELTADRVLAEVMRIAFADLRQLVRPDGSLIPLHELPDEVAAALVSFELVMKNAVATDGVVDRVLRVKTSDKLAALNMLMKHLGLLVDHVLISDGGTLMEKVQAARQRGALLAAERKAAVH